MEQKLKTFLIYHLRFISMKWPPRNEAKKRARIKRGVYKCDGCQEEFKANEIQIDHVKPVIDPVKGFVDIGTYIKRLFCSVDGFQILCKSCHKNKSKEEDEIRKQYKTRSHNVDFRKNRKS